MAAALAVSLVDEVVAEQTVTRRVAYFDARQFAAVEAMLRTQHRTGSLTLDISEGRCLKLRWEEITR